MSAPYMRADELPQATCACGGTVIVGNGANHDQAILEAVRYHQSADREHREWRRRRRELAEPAELLGELGILGGRRPVRTGLLVDVIEAAVSRPVLS